MAQLRFERSHYSRMISHAQPREPQQPPPLVHIPGLKRVKDQKYEPSAKDAAPHPNYAPPTASVPKSARWSVPEISTVCRFPTVRPAPAAYTIWSISIMGGTFEFAG